MTRALDAPKLLLSEEGNIDIDYATFDNTKHSTAQQQLKHLQMPHLLY
jgi:glutaredoxin